MKCKLRSTSGHLWQPRESPAKGRAAQQNERAPSHVFQGLDRALPEAAPTSGLLVACASKLAFSLALSRSV